MDKNLLLVKMVEKFPCLYKSDSMEYSRRDFTDRAWSEVSREINMSVGECKEKWKNLRYGFLRSLRPTRDGLSKKKYYMHDEMEFIIPYARTSAPLLKERVSNYVDEDSDKDEHVNIEGSYENDRFEVTYVADNNGIDIVEPLKKKTKAFEDTHDDNIYHERIKTTDGEDPRRMFLISLLPEIAEFSESQMKVFRRKVLGLVDEINELNNFNVLKLEPL